MLIDVNNREINLILGDRIKVLGDVMEDEGLDSPKLEALEERLDLLFGLRDAEEDKEDA